jgi:hypothetical protein
MDDGGTYRLILRSLPTTPGGIPEAQRLKGLLKSALRQFGFRCIVVVETNAAGGATASARGTRAA